jgi:hypothetical protein
MLSHQLTKGSMQSLGGLRFLLAIVAVQWAVASSASAATLAYWRFEEGPVDADAPAGTPDYVYDQLTFADSTVNGHALEAWTTGSFAGFAYRSSVPAATVPQTGTANNLSVRNTGGFPSSFTGPGTMRTIEPAAFTIEASYKPENGGFRTVVGRDSLGAAMGDVNLAALYLQAVPGNAVAIKFRDKAGFFHEAVSAPGVIQGFDFGTDPAGATGRWYNMAAVSNGSTLSLYLDDVQAGTGYQLVAQTDLTLSGSADTALTMGMGGTTSWSAGDWTVGRGIYAGNHGDRAYGFIDEVRISDAALTPGQFLFAAVPEPTAAAMATFVASALVLPRLRRSRRNGQLN